MGLLGLRRWLRDTMVPPLAAARCAKGWMLVSALLCFSSGGSMAAQPAAGGDSVNVDNLLAQCAPTVHPETMRGILGAESGGHIYAIADAGPVNLPWSVRKSMVRSFYPASLGEAVGIVRRLQAEGHTVSIGPAQVNDRNLRRMKVSLEDAFLPCRNIGLGGEILTSCYASAVKKFGEGGRALDAALSCYNSGDFERGARDGYVGLVYAKAKRPLVLQAGGVSKVASKVPSLAVAGNGGQGNVRPWYARAGMGAAAKTGPVFGMSVTAFGRVQQGGQSTTNNLALSEDVR